METVMVVWFVSLLFGSGFFIGVAEKQAAERAAYKEAHPEAVQVDAGVPERKGTESSSVRTYWDVPKN